MLPNIRQFLKIYLPGKGAWYFWGLVFLVLNVAAVGFVPDLIRRSVELLEGADGALDEASRHELLMLAWWILAVGVCLGVFRVLSRIVLFVPGRMIEDEVRQDYFKAMISLRPSTLSRYPMGDLISRGTSDAANTRVMLSMGVLHTTSSLILLVMCLFFMLRISLALSLLSLVFGPFLFVYTRKQSRKMMELARTARLKLSELSENIRETFRAHTLMAIYPVFDRIMARFDDHNDEYCKLSEDYERVSIPLFSLLGGTIYINQFMLVFIGGLMILNGSDLTIGGLIAFSIYLGLVQEPMRAGGFLISIFQRGEVAIERLFEIINTAREEAALQEQREITQPAQLEAASQNQEPLLAIRNLHYRYAASGDDAGFALDIPSLELQEGKAYGIFGRVGSGKTTLLNILTGTLPVEAGHCFYRGIDYSRIDHELLLSRFAMMPQESRHFGRSIRQNIELVSENPDQPMGTMLQSLPFDTALEVSRFKPDVEFFHDGLDSMLGENGINLSGGQKQRLALMRALVKPHEILFLDDAVSAVDHQTEEAILNGLYAHRQKDVMIFVSHRISALMPCDEILVMDQGRIIDRGTHLELMSRCDAYRRTAEYQTLKQEVEGLDEP
jgi:ATP-binding cassette subfamily B protein